MSRNRLSYEYEPEFDPVDACTSEYEMMRYYNCHLNNDECEQLIDRMMCVAASRYTAVPEASSSVSNNLPVSVNRASINRINRINRNRIYRNVSNQHDFLTIDDKIANLTKALKKASTQEKTISCCLDKMEAEYTELVKENDTITREAKRVRSEAKRIIADYDKQLEILEEKIFRASYLQYPMYMREYTECHRGRIETTFTRIEWNIIDLIESDYLYGAKPKDVYITIGKNLRDTTKRQRREYLTTDKALSWLMTFEYLSINQVKCARDAIYGEEYYYQPALQYVRFNEDDSIIDCGMNVIERLSELIEEWVRGDTDFITIEFSLTDKAAMVFWSRHANRIFSSNHSYITKESIREFNGHLDIDVSKLPDYDEYIELFRSKKSYEETHAHYLTFAKERNHDERVKALAKEIRAYQQNLKNISLRVETIKSTLHMLEIERDVSKR